MAEAISLEKFHALTRCLVGLPLSHAWRGHGSAVLFEFGTLKHRDGKNPEGEATAMLEWSWRVERKRSVSFGSSSGGRKIANGLKALTGSNVVDVAAEGRLPELIVSLSGGVWVRSFTTVEGQPAWTLFLPGGKCLLSRLGRIEIEPRDK